MGKCFGIERDEILRFLCVEDRGSKVNPDKLSYKVVKKCIRLEPQDLDVV